MDTYSFDRKSRSTARDNLQTKLENEFDSLTRCDWYHGRLGRTDAEKRISENGSFLVRESISMGCFIVTTRWNGLYNHVTILPPSEHYQKLFHFDDSRHGFEHVTDLIKFYRDSQIPISSETGAILFTPVTIRLYEKETSINGTRYRRKSRGNSASRPKPFGKGKSRLKKFDSDPLLMVKCDLPRPRCTSNASDGGDGNAKKINEAKKHVSANVIKANSLSSMAVGTEEHKAHVRRGSVGNPCHQSSIDETHNQAPLLQSHPDFHSNDFVDFRVQNRPFRSEKDISDSSVQKPSKPLIRNSGEVFSNRPRPNVSIRNPIKYYDNEGNDYTDYAQVRALSSCLRSTVNIHDDGNYVSMENFKASSGSDSSVQLNTNYDSQRNASQTIDDDPTYIYVSPPSSKNTQSQRSSFLDSYGALPSPDPLIDAQMWNIWLSTGPLMTVAPTTVRLPAFTKPLDSTVWTTVLRLLADTNEDVLAGYIANETCRLLHRFPTSCKIPSLDTGFHLILVPQANCYREHLVNRSYCLSRFVAASILMCKPVERKHIVWKWILVAESLSIIYRDYYSLHALVDGIFCSQVTRVINPVTLVPHNSTLVTTVGKEIRILHRTGDECSLTPHVNVCVPDVVRFIHAYSSSFDDLMVETPASLLEVLTAARGWAAQFVNESYNNQSVWAPWVAVLQPDVSVPILVELFTTEVQMKLLWGARGYNLPTSDRQQKLEVILDAFAKRALSTQPS